MKEKLVSLVVASALVSSCSIIEPVQRYKTIENKKSKDFLSYIYEYTSYSRDSEVKFPGKSVIEYVNYCEINDDFVMQFKAYDSFPYDKDFHPEDSLEINFYSVKKNYPDFNIKKPKLYRSEIKILVLGTQNYNSKDYIDIATPNGVVKHKLKDKRDYKMDKLYESIIGLSSLLIQEKQSKLLNKDMS